jgi:hypothetical protein
MFSSHRSIFFHEWDAGGGGGAPSAKLCISISPAVNASSAVVFFGEPRDLMPGEYGGGRVLNKPRRDETGDRLVIVLLL